MSSAVKKKKDELLGQATAEANQKPAEGQTKNRSNAKSIAKKYTDDNAAARERIGNDPERLQQRLSGIDRNKFDLSGYSDKEINMAMMGDSFGEKDYARLTGKSLDTNNDPGDNQTSEPTPQTAENKPATQQPTTFGQPEDSTGYRKAGTNAETAQYLKQQMEDDYAYSQFKTRNVANKAISGADKDVNYKTQVRGLNDAINKKVDYYRSRTDMQTLGLFGDIWNMKSFDWKAPQKPKPIETTYDTDVDFD